MKKQTDLRWQDKGIDGLKGKYIESQSQCIDTILQYEKDGCYDKKQLIQGCLELRKYETTRVSIATDLELLTSMSKIGVEATIAGQKIREAIIKTKKSWGL